MTSKFSIDNIELLQRISSGEAVVGIDFGNLIVRELAAFRLAAMDSEPVAEVLSNRPGNDTSTIDRALPVGTQLYRHAQPALVVPDDVSIFEAAIEECKTCDSIDEHAWNHGVLAVIAKYESCRAAMLSGGKS